MSYDEIGQRLTTNKNLFADCIQGSAVLLHSLLYSAVLCC